MEMQRQFFFQHSLPDAYGFCKGVDFRRIGFFLYRFPDQLFFEPCDSLNVGRYLSEMVFTDIPEPEALFFSERKRP